MTDKMKISARDANINALKEEISGLHKYIDKLEQQNADMIEAVIEDTMSVEEVFVDMPNLPFKAEHREKHKSRIRLIEKVADMPWQKVKEKNS